MLFKKSIDIQIDENTIKKNRVPILIKDKQWKTIIGDSNNKTIQSLSKQLNDLIDEERTLEKNLKLLRQQKTKVMNKILHLSDLLNTKGQESVLSELEESREEINRINEAIDEMVENLLSYPKEIERVNFALLKETIVSVYKDITTDHNRLSTVDEEIKDLRERLGILRDEKDELEKRVEILYSLLHTIIGYKEMEKLDIRFLKE
ncbi:hypothetical protein SAMN05660297_01271 [Natronincola peptidivorans]|uniref:Uncharacterized protein n=1 Tax=Natronincola peptidivorans TaxID=426128 RepID=A0A1I0BIE9_9FIRM|nr:hypothetical protein [Natronincola peptidivorans]SET06341.1 hypothetical protein SAMN05660297_01271 [Natronincola peptidivorans]